jgi:hypothetical protein
MAAGPPTALAAKRMTAPESPGRRGEPLQHRRELIREPAAGLRLRHEAGADGARQLGLVDGGHLHGGLQEVHPRDRSDADREVERRAVRRRHGAVREAARNVEEVPLM